MKWIKYIWIFGLAIAIAACNSTKTGCPADNAKVKVDKNGMPKQKSKSNLFPKSMRKKMGG